MGVFGLWDLLMTTAQKMTINQLSGKILAIDASIWLVKADSVFSQDSQKIKFILQKIIYLRKNNILPIFVFDGIPPAIKRKTLQKRRQKLRQGSQIDVRKKTEIQVMHLLENAGKQKTDKQSSKDKKLIEKQEQMTQIDKLLDSLSQIQAQKSQVVTDDDINKIRLQSQVLTYKYQLMMQDPRLQGLQKMQMDQFEQLGIEQKLQYIRLLQNEYHSRNSKRNRFQTIKELSKLTPQQQIFYDMEKIQKKTKLRQLQDELYRKTLQQNIKIQNGYEIIEEIRNGKKFVMKRKINTENQNKSLWHSKGNKKQKNDFSAILNYKNKEQEGEEFQQKDGFDMFGNEPDPFLLDLIGKDLKKSKQDQESKSKSLSSSFHPNLKTKAWKIQKDNKQEKKQKQKINSQVNNKSRNASNPQEQKSLKEKVKQQQRPKNNSKSLVIQRQKKQSRENQDMSQKQQSQLNQIVLASLIGQNIKKSQRIQVDQNHTNERTQNSINNNHPRSLEDETNSNPDNLPQFINYQNLLIRHLDTQNARNIEFQKLLQMIGIPYVKALSQAESQCASFQIQGLVDGVVTEDSDVFLFGAKNVFRGVFNDSIKYFSAPKIMQKLKFNRQKLIIFAMLLGSDYTDGIKGIGIVNAMEILKIFDDFDKLQKFKKWARFADILHTDEKNVTQNILKQLSNDEQKQFYAFHKRFKNYWYIDDQFPKMSVINAYLNPEVIDSARIKEMKETKYFELKEFNQQAVRIFMQERLLLTFNETEDYCMYLKRPFKREQQMKVTDLFVGQDHELAKIRSKRLMKAIGKHNQQNTEQKK